VEWLCSRCASPPLTVESQTAVDFVEDGLTAHFFTPMLQDVSQRQKLGVPHAVSCLYGYHNVISPSISRLLTVVYNVTARNTKVLTAEKNISNKNSFKRCLNKYRLIAEMNPDEVVPEMRSGCWKCLPADG